MVRRGARSAPWSNVASPKTPRRCGWVLGLPFPIPISKALSPGPFEWAEAGESEGAGPKAGGTRPPPLRLHPVRQESGPHQGPGSGPERSEMGYQGSVGVG